MKPKPKLVPFTREPYPVGYSRADCEAAIEGTKLSIERAKIHVKDLQRQLREYEAELKRGGRIERNSTTEQPKPSPSRRCVKA